MPPITAGFVQLEYFDFTNMALRFGKIAFKQFYANENQSIMRPSENAGLFSSKHVGIGINYRSTWSSTSDFVGLWIFSVPENEALEQSEFDGDEWINRTDMKVRWRGLVQQSWACWLTPNFQILLMLTWFRTYGLYVFARYRDRPNFIY